MTETENKDVNGVELLAVGFTNVPTLDEIKPTAREQELLDSIWKWREESENSGIVLGEPSGRQDDMNESDS